MLESQVKQVTQAIYIRENNVQPRLYYGYSRSFDSKLLQYKYKQILVEGKLHRRRVFLRKICNLTQSLYLIMLYVPVCLAEP